MSYGITADLLREVLPIGTTANASTIRNHLHQVARRCDADLGVEQVGFIDDCPADWKELPIPEGPIVVGLDGGYAVTMRIVVPSVALTAAGIQVALSGLLSGVIEAADGAALRVAGDDEG